LETPELGMAGALLALALNRKSKRALTKCSSKFKTNQFKINE
jgi:hypothetical protein